MKTCLLLICVVLGAFAFAESQDCILDGHSLKVGETYSEPGRCQLIKCEGQNEFSAKTCPDVKGLGECKYYPQDNSKSYPSCCPRIEC